MPLYSTITQPGHLPAVGAAFETSMFDMKKAAAKKTNPATGKVAFDQYEMAKDVAMFANATGGVILIGAQENGTTGTLAAYHPVSASDAKDVADAYGNATADRCRPSPLIEPVPIDHGGGFLVAVNVNPFPGQAVGVRVAGNKSDGHGGDAFVFPIRIGRRCTFITPEQLPMLMLPNLRYAAIRLAQIPQPAKMGFRVPDGTLYQFSDLNVDAQAATVTVRMTNSGTILNVPLDAIGSVWHNDDLNQWLIQIVGVLRSATRADGKTYYQYGPT